MVALLAFGAEKGDGHGLVSASQAGHRPAEERGHGEGVGASRASHGTRREAPVQRGQGNKILGDRGCVRARLRKILLRTVLYDGSTLWHPQQRGHQLAIARAASGLELAENVRLNNCLPTAVSDALQITELFDIIDLLQDGILLCVLRIAVICFHGIWKPADLQ